MTDAAAARAPRPSPGLIWATVDDEIVVVDARGRAHVLTSTSALLWPLLDGVVTAEELAADVADVFGIDADVARDDVRRFIDRMVAWELVVDSSEAMSPR
jgi:hypothetical protein